MAKNRMDLRDALFDSSEYLADILARCAYIEKEFYRNNSGETTRIGRAVIGVYKEILQYAAEVLVAQNSNVGRWILDSVTAITSQRFAELQSSIKEKEQYLHQWVNLDQHLQQNQKTEMILTRVDEMSMSLQALIQKFSLPIAEGAFYDAYVNQHEDMCLPETRKDLRNQIANWAGSPDSKCIFWLNGMAGTGKSTIARTVAQSFQERGQLGASFFFKKGEADRGNAKRFISTITKQLMTNVRQIAPSVLKVIGNHPDISAKSLREQFDKLLLLPLQDQDLGQRATLVIVVDALDECEQEDDIRIILQLLPQLQQSKSIRLQVLLTSRPELPIRLGFQKSNDHQDLVLHELPERVVKHDIRLFLNDRFSTIRADRKIPGNWPGDDTIERLVEMAVPLFIFAATMCRFIEKRSPEDRLESLLASQEDKFKSQMDKMYLPVLNQLLSDEDEDEDETKLLEEFQDTVAVIILLATPLSIDSLERLLDMRRNTINNILEVLHSVINVPGVADAPVRILHLSFRDYLLSTTSVFHVNESETHWKIASHCLRIMNNCLRLNICSLQSYGTQRTDISSQVIDESLPPDLRYACRYWVYHAELGKAHISEAKVLSFLGKHFLHWLEAMSLMGINLEALGVVNSLQSSMGVSIAQFIIGL